MLHILNIMGREQQRFPAGQRGAHQLDEIPPGKGVLTQKRLIHQVIRHPLGKAGSQLYPCALPGGKPPDRIRAVQGEKFQKFFVPRRVKRGVQVGQQLTIGCHRQRRVIAALAGDITDALVLHPGRPAVQQRCAFVRQKPRNAAQHRCFTSAILAQDAHDLAIRHKEIRTQQAHSRAVAAVGFLQASHLDHSCLLLSFS